MQLEWPFPKTEHEKLDDGASMYHQQQLLLHQRRTTKWYQVNVFGTLPLWYLKATKTKNDEHKHTSTHVINRANHALCRCYTFFSLFLSLSRGCSHFIAIFIKVVIVFFLFLCCLIVAWSPPIFRRLREGTAFKSVLKVRWFIVCGTKKVICLREFTMLCFVLHIFFGPKKEIGLKV